MSGAKPAFIGDDQTRLTIRRALLGGFVLIFALWLVFGYVLSQRLTELESRAATIHTRFAQREELLLTVAAQVLLGSVYLRDVFLDTRPDAVLFYRGEVQDARTQIDQALQQNLPDIRSPIEREHWTRLQTELQQYWDAMMPVLTPELTRNLAEARAVLNEQVIPKRRTIIAISEQIRTLNRDAYQRQGTALALLNRDLRIRIWEMSGVAVVLGLVVAFGATRYAGRLESRIRRQHLQEVERKRELERLSAKLVRAQEDERRTIARELHDEIGQALTAIKIELSIVQDGVEGTGSTADALREARSITDGALHAVRDVSQLLHPTMLDDLGLPDTLTWYLRSFGQRTGLRAELTQDRMDARMSPDVEICAYRIIQEALTNVAKHAHASSCRVYLQRLPGSLLISVEDDGVGVDRSQKIAGASSRGLGLVGIRERVAGLGGTFSLESAAGKGTRLTAEFPFAAGSVDTAEAESADGFFTTGAA